MALRQSAHSVRTLDGRCLVYSVVTLGHLRLRDSWTCNSGKVVGAALVSGAVTHAVLFAGYGMFKAGVIGSVGLVVYGAVVGFTPMILAALASRFFKPELLRPVVVQ